MTNQTPESVIVKALYADEPELHAGSAVQFMKASRRARVAITALRAANMLRECCTCPSGDGSLRWPCPQHPVAPQPSESDREALAKAVFESYHDHQKRRIRGITVWDYISTDLLAAFPALSRATAPAAIERVRDLASSLRGRYAENSDAAYFTSQFLAALDGAPEVLPVVSQINALLGISLWDANSFRAEVRIDFDERGNLLRAELLDGAPEPEWEPCTAEIHSWSKQAFHRNRDIDSYWIRCTLLGKHDEHEDSNTGLTWRSEIPVEGESE